MKGRLQPGVSLDAANADMDAAGKALEAHYPEANRGLSFVVQRELQFRVTSAPFLGGIVVAISGVMLLTLLVGCANVSGLMLDRAHSRSREIGVRLALGSSGFRVIRQLLTETSAISAVGGALGLGVAHLATVHHVVDRELADLVAARARHVPRARHRHPPR